MVLGATRAKNINTSETDLTRHSSQNAFKLCGYNSAVTIEFSGEAIEWRGPAPFVFVPVPRDLSADIKSVAKMASYGWGVIPVLARIGGTDFKTSLFPRGEVYLVPVKLIVQRAEGVKVGDLVSISLEVLIGPS